MNKRKSEYSIGNHGVIGDTYSVALVNMQGTMDWCCFPRFDAAPFFSSILDTQRGGEMRTELVGATSREQMYSKGTNILMSVQKSASCTVEITDFMPVEKMGNTIYSRHECHRIIRCKTGKGRILFSCRPAHNFGIDTSRIEQQDAGFVSHSQRERIAFSFTFPTRIADSAAIASLDMNRGDEEIAVIRWDESITKAPAMKYTGKMLEQTAQFWNEWLRKTSYEGQWKEAVLRSVLVLKLLTYSPTGAITAAPTSSLPEAIGGERNWDYRYSWIRDSAYAIDAFISMHHRDEERNYFNWLLHLLRRRPSDPSTLRVMYTVEGDYVPHELELTDLRGYRSSRPVRVGNGARDQLQLDIYGSIVEAIYLASRNQRLPDALWRICNAIAEFIAANWQREDAGIWEVRGKLERNTHSAVMSFVALQKTGLLAQRLGYRKRADKYSQEAEKIRKWIIENAYNERIGSFVRAAGSEELDASALFVILKGVIDPKSPQSISTIEVMRKHLESHGFLYRYTMDDGLTGKEGAFILCTLWLAQSLALAGKIVEAKEVFELTLAAANHLGLLSEEIAPETGELLGNFPQAFSHLGVVQTALLLTDIEAKSLHARRHARHT
ncbi:MAG: glycoside hydrolase family 15 protein [Methanomassiliicoccales archaeon]